MTAQQLWERTLAEVEAEREGDGRTVEQRLAALGPMVGILCSKAGIAPTHHDLDVVETMIRFQTRAGRAKKVSSDGR